MKKIIFLITLICMSSCMGQEKKTKRVSEDEFPNVKQNILNDFVGLYKGNLNVSNYTGSLQNIPMEIQLKKTATEGEFSYEIMYLINNKKDIRKYMIKTIDLERGHYVIDQRNGLVLQGNLIHNTIFSTFEMNNNIMNSKLQFKNEGKIAFEIVVVTKQNGYDTGGKEKSGPAAKSYTTTIVQRALLTRVDRN